ncbi:MAG: hypothetical protein Fur0032_16340 [Terrimicrobiaceae bacterium]
MLLKCIPEAVAGIFFIVNDENGFSECHFVASNQKENGAGGKEVGANPRRRADGVAADIS